MTSANKALSPKKRTGQAAAEKRAAKLFPYILEGWAPAYQANLNLYRMESLTYKALCSQAGAPLQSGMASAQFDASGTRGHRPAHLGCWSGAVWPTN